MQCLAMGNAYIHQPGPAENLPVTNNSCSRNNKKTCARGQAAAAASAAAARRVRRAVSYDHRRRGRRWEGGLREAFNGAVPSTDVPSETAAGCTTQARETTHACARQSLAPAMRRRSYKPKFHLARHVTSRHDTTRTTCRVRRDERVEPCLFQHGGRRRSSSARVY